MNKRQWRKTKYCQGASLVMVMVIAALFFVLALTLIYTAGMTMATANKRVYREQSYQLCKSFSKLLEEELVGEDKNVNESGTFYAHMVKSVKSQGSKKSLDTLYELTEQPEGTIAGECSYRFKIHLDNRYPGFSFPEPGNETDDLIVERYEISIVTTATFHNTQYSLESKYLCRETYQPRVETDGEGSVIRYYYDKDNPDEISFVNTASEDER